MISHIKCKYCGADIEITEALEKEASKALSEEFERKLKSVQGEAQDEKQRNRQLLSQIEELTKEIRHTRQEKEEAEIRMQKKLMQEEEKIRLDAKGKVEQEYRLRELEKEKTIQDLKTALENAKRRAEVGSQQMQGEVLELDLEKTLKESFSGDGIAPIGKGVRGADIKQIVKTPKGNPCGIILWETKRTRAWKDEWLGKLKEDIRTEKADVPIIISNILPKDISGEIGTKDGVWVAKPSAALPLAILVRRNFLDVARQKAVSSNKDQKAVMVFEYITGNEFRQQVEALVEVYKEMQEEIIRERTVFEKSWKAREGQIRRIIFSTARVYGSLEGLAGSAMPTLPGLDIMELGEGKEV